MDPLPSATTPATQTSGIPDLPAPAPHKGWIPRAIYLILLAHLLLRLPLLFAPLSYSTDVWRQADTASIAHHFFRNGFHLLYPQIFWGGTGPGYVETEFQLYPFLVSLLYAVVGEHLWLGRLVSLLFALPTILLFYLLSRRLIDGRAALLATCFFGISPLYIRYSLAFMPESTVLFFYVLALYLFCRFLEQQKLSLLLCAAAATALAILVKPTAAHVGLVFLLLLLLRLGPRAFLRWDIWAFGVISLLPALLWYLHARDLYLQYGNTFGILSGGDSKFGNLGYWTRPAFYLALWRLDQEWLFSKAGSVLFLTGLLLCLIRRRPVLLLCGAVTILVYYMIVARYAQARWGIQYHVFALPYAALGIGIALSWLLDPRSWPAQRPLGGILFVLFALGIGTRTCVAYRAMLHPGPNPEIECGQTVARIVPPGARIIVATTSRSRDGGVPNNYQDPVVFFYSQRYGFSLPADRFTPEALTELQRAGGAYLVVPGEEVLAARKDMADFLQAHAEQVGPGVAAGCGVYRLGK